MSARTPNLSLPYIQASQAQKHVTHNEALRTLDALVQLSVRRQDLGAPPSDLVSGDRFIVAAPASGDWGGQEGAIAIWDQSVWTFLAPAPGWRIWDQNQRTLFAYDGNAWVSVTPDLQNLDHIGINTTADTTNRLAVSAPATLLSHEGSDHRLAINKAGLSDTASMVFQTNWEARAELGTTSSDDFQIKVSPDGTTYHTALQIDHGTGIMTHPHKPCFITHSTGGFQKISTQNTKLNLNNVVDHDTNGDFDTDQNRFVCPATGQYSFTVNLFCWSGTTSNSRIAFGVNGTYMRDQMSLAPIGGGHLSLSNVLSLSVGDVVDVRTANGTGTLEYYRGHSGWSGYKI